MKQREPIISRDAPHCPELGPVSGRALTAVLDGQQRLTALNIGLRGSMAVRREYGSRNNPRAYPKWHLFLNLLSNQELSDGSDEEVALTKEKSGRNLSDFSAVWRRECLRKKAARM